MNPFDIFSVIIGGPYGLLVNAFDYARMAANAAITSYSAKDPVGAGMILAGALIAAFVPGGQAFGATLATSGALKIASGAIFYEPPMENPKRDSPTYGITQFGNRATGDVCIPVVYSNDTASSEPGHRVAPIYVQAYVTPKGYEDVEFSRTKGTRGQSVSCLFAVAEGPIESIDDVRVNDEPLWEIIKDRAVEEKANGTRKQFTLPCQHPDLYFLNVKVAGVSKGWARTTVTNVIGTGASGGTKTVYRFILPDSDGGQQEIDTAAEVVFYRGWNITAAAALSVDSTAELRPVAWLESRNELVIWTQRPLQSGEVLQASVPIRKLDGLTATYISDKKQVRLDFITAPASGATVTCSLRRKALSSVRVEYRMGASHQLPIEGFDAVRNEVSVGIELQKGSAPTERTADEPVDDLVVDVACLGGLCAIDDNDGSVVPRTVEFSMDWKPEGGTKWFNIRDPGDPAGSKTSLQHRLAGNSTSALFFSFSLRNMLKQWVAKNPKDSAAAAELALLRRGKHTIRLWRISSNPTDPLVRDTMTWTSYEKVIDERLSYPGVALLSLHGVSSSKLQGGLPQVTCRVAGLRAVESYSGGTWSPSSTAQANPVWAAVDLITAKRYGGGEQFTKAANIDTTTAATAAAWCDTTCSDGNGGTEKQGVLDMVLDTRADLMEQVSRILLPHRVVPVLQGNVWKFVIDRDVTLSDCTIVYDDGSDGVTLADSLRFSHQEQTSQITELQLSYLDRDDDHERNEIWVAPSAPADDRRIQRASADGITRSSEATRYAKWLHAKASQQGMNLSWSMVPSGLRYEAGDVVRVVSTRLGIDLYARIMRWTVPSTESMVVQIEAAQYIPAVYGQNVAAQTVTKPTKPQDLAVSSPTSSVPTTSGTTYTSSAKTGVTIRRAA